MAAALCVADPLLDWPLGPVTVPEVVEVPLPLFTVVPLTVVVPPFTPVTLPDSFVPVLVFVTEPCAEALRPLAPVTEAAPFAVLPEREAPAVAVVP